MTTPAKLLCIAAVLVAIPAALAASAMTKADARSVTASAACRVAAGPTVRITSVRNMSCRGAVTEMRRYRGSIGRTFRTPGGFSCSRVSGGRLAGVWRCVRGGRAFRLASPTESRPARGGPQSGRPVVPAAVRA